MMLLNPPVGYGNNRIGKIGGDQGLIISSKEVLKFSNFVGKYSVVGVSKQQNRKKVSSLQTEVQR